MKPKQNKLTIDLGPLAALVDAKLETTGETRSKYARRLIADDLGVDAPTMQGFVKNLRQYQNPKKRKR